MWEYLLLFLNNGSHLTLFIVIVYPIYLVSPSSMNYHWDYAKVCCCSFDGAGIYGRLLGNILRFLGSALGYCIIVQTDPTKSICGKNIGILYYRLLWRLESIHLINDAYVWLWTYNIGNDSLFVGSKWFILSNPQRKINITLYVSITYFNYFNYDWYVLIYYKKTM
jgi:hypothetical protein